jgi:hypothetical protein
VRRAVPGTYPGGTEGGGPQVGQAQPLNLLENWAIIEADFQREYRLDLTQELPGMTWRRFMVLVNGLGPHSAWVTLQVHKKQQPVLITDQEAAERHMESLLG